MKRLHLIFLLLSVFACRRDQEPEPEDFGFLSMSISVEITEEEANARTEAVSTDDFILIIYDVGDNVVMTFDPFSTAPAEVQLSVGEYYVVANSNDMIEAGFDNPYYFGRSANFTIDKEEVKTVDIIATLANAKVAINYSAGVVNTFDVYEGVVTITGSGTTLTYMTGETREGYFVTTSPLGVEVSLVYNKLDGSTIERSLKATISDPQPKTLYNINVDAVLEDGNIVFNLTVDESFDTVDIDLESNPLIVSKLFGGSSLDRGFDIISLADGNFLIVGSTNSNDGNVNLNKGLSDVWLLKLDEDGNLLWEKTYGGSDNDVGSKALENPDGTITVFGSTSSEDGDVSFSNPGVNGDYWLFKIDAGGNLLWEKSYGYFQWDFAADFIQLPDGGYLLTGSTQAFDLFSPDAYIIRTDVNGNVIWEKIINEVGWLGFVGVFEKNGMYYIGGYEEFSGPAINDNVVLIEIDIDGEVGFLSKLNQPGLDDLTDMTIMNGDFILSGTLFGSTSSFLISVDDTGAKNWFNDYSSGYFRSTTVLGNDIVASGTFLDENSAQFGFSTIDAFGNLITSEMYGSDLNEYTSEIVTNSSGHLVVVGNVSLLNGDQQIAFARLIP